jgi:PAS domain S-box-containing protein
LVERIFNGVRTPILALSSIEEGPPTILDCNQAASKLIGYERSEIVDRSVEFLNSDGHSKVDLWKPLRSAGKRSFDIVGRELRRKDGTIFLADLKVSPLLNGRGKQVGSITVVSDLTQRNKMEAKRLRYEDRLVALHRHSVQLSSATTMDAIVDFTIGAMQEALDVRNVDFNVVGKNEIRMVKSAGVPPKDALIVLPRNGPGIVVKAANTRKTLLIPNTRQEPSFVDARVSDPTEGSVHILSELATPVLVDDEAVAVLNVESDRLNAFSGEDEKYLEVIAFHAGSAIKRLIYEEKLTALHTHALKLSAATSIDEIVNHTLDAMIFGLGFDHSDVWITQGGSLRCKGARGMVLMYPDLRLDGPGVIERAANSKRTIRIADTRKEPSYVDRMHDKGPESPTMLSELAVPVVVDDRTSAVLNVESSKPNAITDSDQRLLEILTTHVASAIRRMKDEEALANERNVLRTLIDTLPDNIFIKDAESRFMISNLAHARLLRAKTPDEIVGKTDYDIFPHELAASYYADEQAVIRSGQPLLNREERTMDPEGKTRWLLTTKVPLRDDHGKVIGIAGINRDITERKQMEDELRESESRYRTLFDSTNDAIFIHDMGGKFLEVNKVACERLGYSREELLQMTPADIDAAEHSATVQQRVEELNRIGHHYAEIVQVRRDGTTIPTELSSRLIEFKGKPAVLSIARDITERKKMEEAVHGQADLLQKTLNSMTDAMFILEAKVPPAAPTILECNQAACIVFGYDKTELLGKTTDFLHASGETLKEFQSQLYSAVQQGRLPFHLHEFRMKRKDGSIFPSEHSVSQLLNEKGERTGWVSIVRDISAS